MNSSEQQPMIPSNKRANKRLKVGRACYTCRAKKIKCDGLRPCMQCKARQRPCSFYKDGFLETDQEHSNQLDDTDNITTNDRRNMESVSLTSAPTTTTVLPSALSSVATPTSDPNTDGSILFAETSTVNHNKLKRRGPLMESRISNTLGSLGENMRKMSTASSSRLAEKLLNSTETFGNFIMWMPEPSLPSRYSGSIEMPSREIQMALIDQYFNERHESIGMIVKYYFYEQLETKGLLITPLLLNIIYAHAARFVTIPGCPKTEVFYHRARRLVDDFMDVPRVSTVMALCLLSLYEPSPAIYRPGSHHCRQWQYSGMACRMSLELGLYDDNNVHSSLTPVEIEMRRRVFWGCYDLDKFQSGGWERPWMISHTFIRTLYPSKLPEESEDDALILDVSTTKIRFVKIVEENLILLSASQTFLGGNNGSDLFLGIHKDNMLNSISENHAKHQQWLRSLKPGMQWTPTTTISIKDVLDLPAPRPMVGHLHLYYNTLCLALLTRLPNNSVAQFQSRVIAACMTQLAYHLCQTPSYIVKFDFIVHALIHAIKIHIRYLDDPDVNLAQQAWLLFDRSIWCMQLINSYAVIPNCTKFLQQVQNIYGLHMTDNSRSTSSSPSPSPKKQQRSQANIGFNQDPLSSMQQPINASVQGASSSSMQQQQQLPTINLGQTGSPSLQHHQSGINLTSETHNSNSNNKMMNTMQVPDDINQILTDWSSATPTTTNTTNDRNNILQLDPNSNPNRTSNMVYLNSHNPTTVHPQQQYHPFNTRNQTAQQNLSHHHHHHGYQQQQQASTNNTNFSTNQHHTHTRTLSNHQQQQVIWNNTAPTPDNRYNTTTNSSNSNNSNDNNNNSSNSDIMSYNSREIIVPSQLNDEGPTTTTTTTTTTTSDNNTANASIFQQQQQVLSHSNNNNDGSGGGGTRYNHHHHCQSTGESSLWQQQQPQNTSSVVVDGQDPDQDGDTPVSRGLGICMSSRQHYEEMIKRPPPPQ